jgi:hypothetical protein
MSADITLCTGEGCPHRARCYRHRLRAFGRQNHFDAPPFDAKTGTCTALWDLAMLAPTEQAIQGRAYQIWQTAGCQEGQSEANWSQACQELEDSLRERLRPLEEGDPC